MRRISDGSKKINRRKVAHFIAFWPKNNLIYFDFLKFSISKNTFSKFIQIFKYRTFFFYPNLKKNIYSKYCINKQLSQRFGKRFFRCIKCNESKKSTHYNKCLNRNNFLVFYFILRTKEKWLLTNSNFYLFIIALFRAKYCN